MSFWGNETSIRFPNLGIELSGVPRGIAIGSFHIAFYGVVIACGMLLGLAMARRKARKTGQDQDIYLDFALWAIPLSVLGARLYFVAFEWEDYKWDILKIINIREGGLAIYGGVIVAVLSVIVYCRVKKLRMGLMIDTSIFGLILGQIIGRWGNFFNREAFGKYTNSIMAMQIDVSDQNLSSLYNPALYSESTLRTLYEGKERALDNILEIRNNIVTLSDGRQFIQVHPTFLYESLWNLALLIAMIFIWPKKKFNGEIVLIYLAGYGFGRFFIEGLRTDQLFLWGTGLAVSQLLSALLFIVAATLLIIFRTKAIRSGEYMNVPMTLKMECANVNSDKAENAVNANTDEANDDRTNDGKNASESEEASVVKDKEEI